MRVTAKVLLIWASILLLAIANGALREALLVPGLGHDGGYLLSGVMLSLLIVGVTYAALPWLGLRTARSVSAAGAGWLLLTLIFEFSFGLVQGKSIAALLQMYTFSDGNIWPVVLLVTASSPYLAAKLRGYL